MKLRIKPIWTGIGWAIATLAVGNCPLWALSLSSTILTYFWLILYLLPAPLLLGALAGVLAQIRCRTYCRGRAAALGVVGMLGFYGGFALTIALTSDWLPPGLLSIIGVWAGGLLIAAIVELIVAALIIGVAYLFDRIDNRRPRNENGGRP